MALLYILDEILHHLNTHTHHTHTHTHTHTNRLVRVKKITEELVSHGMSG